MNLKRYPFVNPIIVDKDHNIVDGQNRYAACIQLGCVIKHIEVDSVYDIEKIKAIKEKQRIDLENFFRKNRIDFRDQLIQVSSTDKMEKFIYFKERLKSDADYWRTLANCYQNSDNNYRVVKEIKELFLSDRKDRHFLMAPEEINYLNALDDHVTIYRGMTVEEKDSGDYGVSWTLNKSVAETFANTYIRNYDTNHLEKTVMELRIPKSEIIAIFIDREEVEVIYVHKKT